jgi:hypothetical protein
MISTGRSAILMAAQASGVLAAPAHAPSASRLAPARPCLNHASFRRFIVSSQIRFGENDDAIVFCNLQAARFGLFAVSAALA